MTNSPTNAVCEILRGVEMKPRQFAVRVMFANGNYGNLHCDAKSKAEARQIIRESLPGAKIKIGQVWRVSP